MQFMAVKLTDINKYSPKSSDKFFFDNNVWMYLFCPLADYKKLKQKHYSAFLQSITTSRSTIFISSLILSEFTNRYLRMDFEQWKIENEIFDADFKKDYVGTTRYKDTVTEIKRNINQIMKLCDKTSDNFNALDCDTILKHLSYIDFNDSYYLELAKLGKWKIVTDDTDFVTYQDHEVEIITVVK
jgi:predicted nucleic acid-binding protein